MIDTPDNNPEITVSFIPVRVVMDPVNDLFRELEVLVLRHPRLRLEMRDAIDDVFAHTPRYLRCTCDLRTAERAGERVVFIEPTERFTELLVAVRTRAAELDGVDVSIRKH